MIVKILSRHNPSYASLIDYILKEAKTTEKEYQIFTHNIRSENQKEWVQEFKENESFRLQYRKNSVMAYHEIISISSLENKNEISREMLDDLVRKYIELRGKDGMYIGAVHHDKNHIHIHFMSSGLAFRTGKAFRLSRSDLQTLKVDLQKYHILKYPSLQKSICEHGTNKPYYSQREWQVMQREQRSLQKTGIRETINSCFSKATSQQEFLSLLRDSELYHYERKGKAQGIVSKDGMKFRFSRFGINISTLAKDLREEQKTLNEIQELRQSRMKHKHLLHEIN